MDSLGWSAAATRTVITADRSGIWRFTAPARNSSVPLLRHRARELLRDHQDRVPEELAHVLLLILTELVTNVVRHAALLTPEVAVELRLEADAVRVAVQDGHPHQPRTLPQNPEVEQTGGRGLPLVRELALEAGGGCEIERAEGGGKVVSATLPLPGRERPAAPPRAATSARRPPPPPG